MAIFAVPLGMPVKKPFVTPLKARGSAAFSHEAEDLVVFSPRLYKVLLIQICNLPAMGDAGSYTRPWVDTDSVSNSKGREKGGKACRYGQYLLDYIANERA
jgi:hypothetical protein